MLGFEHGYSLASPDTLTIWEAQFGDFANGAQIVIDQFISSSEAKWHRLSGLVMLLPHGFEGQGPEHSSARLERFLQLCAGGNMHVAMPTTPAQIFHLLRRQMLGNTRRPLVVMSPKSLLRHPKAVSDVSELTSGGFNPVLADETASAKRTKSVVLCSGKVYYDLLAAREEQNRDDVALIRLEELHPAPIPALQKALAPYAKVTRRLWVQEEPRNQGAWAYVLDNIVPHIGVLDYVGRPSSASPAVGSAKRHAEEQAAIVQTVFQTK